MYLVHILLQPVAGEGELPSDVAAIMAASAVHGRAPAHIAVHPERAPNPVIGVYVHAASLEEAELLVEDLWWRACASARELRRWILLRAEVPLVPLGDDLPF